MRPSAFNLLFNPRLNKGLCFSEAERENYGLLGLLPDAIETDEILLQRARLHLSQKPNDLERYIYLSELQDRNERAFYQLLRSDPPQYMPIVYTPTVGEACQKFGHILRRPKGLYCSVRHRGRLDDLLRNWPNREVRFICVTDGERILGLGDLGVCGMGIPVGKLTLYAAVGGVPPEACLPVILDVGTDNQQFLADPLYPGVRSTRLRGADYDSFVEEFVQSVQKVFPNAAIQFEDFHNTTAIPLLARYRDRICCFNDDIQGTAATAVAGLFGACRLIGNKLSDHRVLFLGGGSAAVGIAELIELQMQRDGLSLAQARERLWMHNSSGLCVKSNPRLSPHQLAYTKDAPLFTDFAEAVAFVKPTVIIGASTVPKSFNERVIRTMSALNERPVIFPLSNPTSKSECSAEEAYQWSDGRAIFASGSPFPPVRIGDKLFVPGQGNNVYIFPAVGLAVYATIATRVTEAMFLRAAETLASRVTQGDLDVGLVYPPLRTILQSEIAVAIEVAKLIFAEGFARVPEPADIDAFVRSKVYDPAFIEMT